MLCASSDGDRYRSPGIASVADMTGDLIAGGVKDRSGKCGGNREVPGRKLCGMDWSALSLVHTPISAAVGSRREVAICAG